MRETEICAHSSDSTHHTPAAKLMPCGISAMCLENALGDIQTNRADFFHGRLLHRGSTHPPWHINAVGGRPPHQATPIVILKSRGDEPHLIILTDKISGSFADHDRRSVDITAGYFGHDTGVGYTQVFDTQHA
jgi:hypothetical protein